MTGSSYIPIVVPIMAFVAMFFWLGLVFYADSHPGWKPGRQSRRASAPAGPNTLPGLDAMTATARPALDSGESPEENVSEPDRGRATGEAPVGASR